MEPTLTTSGARLVALLIALLVACATNLMLVCSWLQSELGTIRFRAASESRSSLAVPSTSCERIRKGDIHGE
jgi:hypothetical protein